MDKKKLAKGVMAALLLTTSAANAASFDAGHEATTFLAVAGCNGGNGYNTAPPRGGYQPNGYGSEYTADDSNNPYARPGTSQGNMSGSMGGGYGYNPNRQDSGASYGSTEWQSSPSGANRRMGGGNQQNYPAQGSSTSGSYNTNRGNNASNPYNNAGGGVY